MNTPNRLNIAKWIIALRSGRYKQAKSVLRKVVPLFPASYCCLGVACEISKLGYWKHKVYMTEMSSSSAILPLDVAGWLGLDTLPKVVGETNAIAANDDHGMSFKQIADGLEKLYLGGEKAEDIVRIALAEPKAWRILAEEYDADNTSSYFLCNSLTFGAALQEIPLDVREAMRQRICFNLDGFATAYDDDTVTYTEGREARVLACLMFAEQAADEVGAA